MSDGTTRRVAGTVFSDGRPRLIQIKDINLDAEFAPHMLYVVNEDKPGFIGKLGTLLGDAKVNIANFTLGRSAPGQDAIALIEVDGPVPDAVAEAVAKLPQVKHAKPLASKLERPHFSVAATAGRRPFARSLRPSDPAQRRFRRSCAGVNDSGRRQRSRRRADLRCDSGSRLNDSRRSGDQRRN